MTQKIEMILLYAHSFLGLPYIWGGSHPSLGYDCSGFVQEVLAGVGLDPKGDQSAQTLCDILKQGPWKEGLQAGSILFFGKGDRQIIHTAIALDNNYMMEAGGGDSSCVSKEVAIKRNAFIRIRPILNRSDLICALYPIHII